MTAVDKVIVDCSDDTETRQSLTAAELADHDRRGAATTAAEEAKAVRDMRLEQLRAKGAAAMTPAERNEAIDLLLTPRT